MIGTDRKRVKRKIRRERAKQRIRELMRKNEISPDELKLRPRRKKSKPRTPEESGFPQKEEEGEGETINPIGKKIRGFQRWLRNLGNGPSVTKGAGRPVESVFEDIFGGDN